MMKKNTLKSPGFLTRLIVCFADIPLFFALLAVILLPLANFLPIFFPPITDPTQILIAQLSTGAFIIAIFIGYYAGFESSSFQGTPAMRLAGLKVIDLDGKRISFSKGVSRIFAGFGTFPVPFIGIHPSLIILNDTTNLTLQEKCSKTRLVYR